MSLDVSHPQFRQWTKQAARLITDFMESRSDGPVFAGQTPRQVRALLEEPLPAGPSDMEQVLEDVRRQVLPSVTHSAGPRYFGYITGGGNQAAVLAELINASLNQNNLKWHASPVSTELERLVMRWVARFIGYTTDSAGVLLSGGSVANYHALAVARTVKARIDIAEEGVYESAPMTVYVSAEAHSSFDKAMDMLGLGRRWLRKIPVNRDLQIDPQALEQQVRRDKEQGRLPICAVGVAGTTNTGAVDDLEAVAGVCDRHDLWYHVDAAYGGPAARLPEKKALFRGMGRADSVVVNPHKWMYVPFEAGGLLVKNPEHLRRTFSTIPDYLKSDRSEKEGERTDLMEYNLPLTKEFRALKVWMTLKTYGADRICQSIQDDIDKAAYLARRVEEAPDLELMAPAPLSIVCFRCKPGGRTSAELNRLNDELISRIEQDGRIFLTGTKIGGATALRVCFINHRTRRSDIDYMLDVIAALSGT